MIGDVHVFPTEEVQEKHHELTPYCWCQPEQDVEDGIWIHHEAVVQ